jgi:hypothetical protein
MSRYFVIHPDTRIHRRVSGSYPESGHHRRFLSSANGSVTPVFTAADSGPADTRSC